MGPQIWWNIQPQKGLMGFCVSMTARYDTVSSKDDTMSTIHGVLVCCSTRIDVCLLLG